MEVVGLLVDFVRVDSRRQDERGVHEASALVGQERSREVDQTVEQQDDGILVAVAVPTSGGDEIGMGEAGIRIRESDDSGEHRSEEHTSELQSRFDLVCRLLLEKK